MLNHYSPAEQRAQIAEMERRGIKVRLVTPDPVAVERDRLRAEVERLREALQWYADGNNYVEDDEFTEDGTTFLGCSAVDRDCGSRATSALADVPTIAYYKLIGPYGPFSRRYPTLEAAEAMRAAGGWDYPIRGYSAVHKVAWYERESDRPAEHGIAAGNVWTTYACGIHGHEGVNRGQPCPHRCRAV